MNVVSKTFYRVHAVYVVAAYTTTFTCMLWISFAYYNIHFHVVGFICIPQRAITFFFWAHHLINENPLTGFGPFPLFRENYSHKKTKQKKTNFHLIPSESASLSSLSLSLERDLPPALFFILLAKSSGNQSLSLSPPLLEAYEIIQILVSGV